MKWPKIRIRRETIERTLIVCSAALVLLLSLKRSGTNGEPYEEPLEDIPQGEISVSSAQTADTRETVVYYEDGDGYLVPVQRRHHASGRHREGHAGADGAKPEKRHGRRAAGTCPRCAGRTTFDLDISGGHARVDMSAQVLNAQDKQQEENMRTAIVWALTEFDTVKDVHFLVDGQNRGTLTHGTNIGGSYTRVGLNREAVSQETFADSEEIQVFFPTQNGRLLVPVSRTIYGSDDVATAVFEFLRGPRADSGLETPLAQSVQLLGIDVSDGTVTINFSGDFTKIAEQSDGGIQAMRALMMTCTRYPGIKKVKILVDGKPYQLPVTDVPTFANIASGLKTAIPK